MNTYSNRSTISRVLHTHGRWLMYIALAADASMSVHRQLRRVNTGSTAAAQVHLPVHVADDVGIGGHVQIRREIGDHDQVGSNSHVSCTEASLQLLLPCQDAVQRAHHLQNPHPQPSHCSGPPESSVLPVLASLTPLFKCECP